MCLFHSFVSYPDVYGKYASYTIQRDIPQMCGANGKCIDLWCNQTFAEVLSPHSIPQRKTFDCMNYWNEYKPSKRNENQSGDFRSKTVMSVFGDNIWEEWRNPLLALAPITISKDEKCIRAFVQWHCISSKDLQKIFSVSKNFEHVEENIFSQKHDETKTNDYFH